MRLPLPQLVLLAAAAFALAGCRQDMHDQPRYEPLEKSDFYADKRSERAYVEGTVPASIELVDNSAYYTGHIGGAPLNAYPFEMTEADLRRGQDRYNVYCAPCHSRVGDGNGMIVQRGFRQPPSFHVDRLRTSPPGHFFEVMTRGFGAMPDYAAQVGVRDRWRIAAYIRALQLSQWAPAADVPAAQQGKVWSKEELEKYIRQQEAAGTTLPQKTEAPR